MDYESIGQRCPKCKCHFRVLADEEGMHECPRCGYGREEDEEQGEDAPKEDG